MVVTEAIDTRAETCVKRLTRAAVWTGVAAHITDSAQELRAMQAGALVVWALPATADLFLARLRLLLLLGSPRPIEEAVAVLNHNTLEIGTKRYFLTAKRTALVKKLLDASGIPVPTSALGPSEGAVRHLVEEIRDLLCEEAWRIETWRCSGYRWRDAMRQP